MTSKELIEIAEKWQKEKEDRTIIVITSEPEEGNASVNQTFISGRRHNLLLSLFAFMKEKVDLMEEATKFGALNVFIKEILSKGPIDQEKVKKECAQDLMKKVLKDIIS